MIRKFQAEDTEAVIAVWQAASALAHPFLSETFVARETDNLRSLYLPNAETWILEDGGVPVGFIALIGGEIGGLFLLPALHGKGHGRALVDHAVGLKGPLTVEVFDRNTIGRRFYQRYGFVDSETYRHEGSGELTRKMAMPST